MMTLSALAMMKAASSAEPDLTGRCSLAPAGPASAGAPPKPPRITLKNERFIALHMMYDRIAPDDPTSEPAMISIALFSEKPMPAAAQPEYEFSIDTTTGMSAPPMGMMISTPSTKAIAAITTNGVHAGSLPPAKQNASPSPTITSASTRFSRCWPAKLTGAPWNSRNLYLPDSLPNAITEPEKVMAPTKVPMNSSMRLPKGSASPTAAMPKACGSDTAATAMQTAARPISECMAATSSGILVISTFFASIAPMPPPTMTPSATSAKPRPPVVDSAFSFMIKATVVTAAMAMPDMPKALPRRAVAGDDKPLSAWMKQTEAIRYIIVTRFMLMKLMLFSAPLMAGPPAWRPWAPFS